MRGKQEPGAVYESGPDRGIIAYGVLRGRQNRLPSFFAAIRFSQKRAEKERNHNFYSGILFEKAVELSISGLWEGRNLNGMAEEHE